MFDKLSQQKKQFSLSAKLLLLFYEIN